MVLYRRVTRGLAGAVLIAAVAVPVAVPVALPAAAAAGPTAPTGASAAAAAATTGPTGTGATATAGTDTTDTTPRTVTLLTGDRVTVTAGDKASIAPGPGRADVGFLTRRVGDRVTVIPTDALILLRTGRLDERLFDVTTLLRFGYDQRPALPLLVTYTGPEARGQGRADVIGAGARVIRELASIDGLALAVDRPTLGDFWTRLTATSGPERTAEGERTLNAGIRTVWLDGLRQPALAESVPQVGAPAAWAAGYDGTGVTVAVLDTGVDASHPALAGRVTARENFTAGAEDDRDLVGHGTHVASTVAGGGGGFTGVAPGARLLDAKVCTVDGCAESWIIAGMQWAAEKGARVVNLSLGGPDTAAQDPLEQAVQELTATHDTLFVASAGNVPGAGTIGSPASADAALAVGAVTKSDRLADFSSQGPRTGDGAIKPDLTAPGVEITAARGRDAAAGPPGEAGTTMSGTSMAAPHVAGAAAIVAQAQPDLSATALKSALMATARPATGLDVFAQGAGRLDLARAVTQRITTAPASLSFGRQAWPHDDDTPVTRTITYRNDGSTPVTLQLTVRATAPDGTPVPAGTFTVSPVTLTVPAGQTAEATVTADTRGAGGPQGQLSGELVGTADGGVSVRSVLAVEREVESYDVTVTHLGRDGTAAAGYLTTLASLDGPLSRNLPTSDGTVTIRLPKGRYAALTVITSPEGDSHITGVLAQPELTVTGDRNVTLDSRLGQPVEVTVPRTDAGQVFAEAAVSVLGTGRSVEVGSVSSGFNRLRTGRVGPDLAATGFVSRLTATFAPTDPADTSYAYLLCWLSEGRMTSGFSRQVAPAELATVRADHGHETAGSSGQKLAWAVLPEQVMGGFAHPMTYPLPSARTEYYNTDGRAGWFRSAEEITGSGDTQQSLTSLVAPPVTYRPGWSYQERWTRRVFGPTVAAPPYEHQWVTRQGDIISVLAPLYGDGAGRAGFSSLATGRISVERDGEPMAGVDGLTGRVEVPPGAANYRLTIDAEREGPAVLSTRVGVAWTFRSAHVDGDAPVRLPLSTVSFAPPVDAENSAPAGRPALVPVTVTAQPDSGAGANRTLTVEVSYDDGETWTEAEVVGGQAVLRHPDAPGYVSLRASATDIAGNTVTQTVIRAYRIG